MPILSTLTELLLVTRQEINTATAGINLGLNTIFINIYDYLKQIAKKFDPTQVGGGISSDNINNFAIQANNIADNSVQARSVVLKSKTAPNTQPTNTPIGANVPGQGGVDVTGPIAITTTFANSQINLKFQQIVLTTSGAGRYFIVKNIVRSTSASFPTGITTQVIMQSIEEITVSGDSWLPIKDEVDTSVSAIATYYFKYTIRCDIFNGSSNITNRLETKNDNGSSLIGASWNKYTVTQPSVA
jgi:hypothetical protein